MLSIAIMYSSSNADTRPVNEYQCNDGVYVKNRGNGGLGIYTYSAGFSLSLDYDKQSKQYKYYDKYDEDIYSNVKVNNLGEIWYDDTTNVKFSSKSPFKIEVIINPSITVNKIKLKQKYICNSVSQRGRDSNGKGHLATELLDFRYKSLYEEIKSKLSNRDISRLDEFWYTANFGQYNGSTRDEISKSIKAYKKIIIKRAIKFGAITEQNIISKLQAYDDIYLLKYGL